MTLLGLIVALVIIGFVLWVINTYVPMEPGIKKLLNVLVILVVVFWILNGMGLLSALNVPIRR